MNQGTSRKDRALKALDPESFKMDTRSLRDIYADNQHFAAAVIFEDRGGSHTWEALFEEGFYYLEAADNEDYNTFLHKNCPPHLAVFLSFLRLFKSLQQEYNGLAQEHLSFFFERVLGQKPQTLKGDKVYLFFELAKNTERFKLEKETSFPAGKNIQKGDILYTLDQETLLNTAKISQIKGLYSSKSAGEGIYAYNDQPTMEANNARAKSAEDASSVGWLPFGNPNIWKESAAMGFAIQHSILKLLEGERYIDLVLHLDESSAVLLDGSFWNPAFWRVAFALENGTFVKSLEGLDYTGDTLVFSVKLSKLDPPLTSIENPILQFLLAEGYAYDSYFFFSKIIIREITIHVEGKGLRNLNLSNDYGVLNAGQAFALFGYAPVVGSNFFITAEELSAKNLEEVAVTCAWQGLPENLKAYYEGYLGQTNSLVGGKEDFKIAVAVKKAKEWIPISNLKEADFELFTPPIHFKVPNNTFTTQLLNTEGNSIRFTLAAPKRAFGHGLYPSVYTKAILAQVQQKDEPIPNPPYTPTVESITLDYTASALINFREMSDAEASFFHIEPFGSQIPKRELSGISLLSDEYQAGGQLFLGISDMTPSQQLSLFFDILEENVLEKPKILISYLTETGWEPFAKNQLLSDGTQGLTKTGILTLDLPVGAARTNASMPQGLHWLKLETPSAPERFDRIFALRTNAVLANLDTRTVGGDYPVNTLAPNAISTFRYKKREVKKIEQPYSSFNGKAAEDSQRFFLRVSEQLAHKNRGITAWDIEHLILQHFDSVYQVFCDTGAAKLDITVIPKMSTSRILVLRKPLATNSLLLGIKIFLTNRVSPHVNLEVRSPAYEEVKIDAMISFKGNIDDGFYLKSLDESLIRFLSPWAFDQNRKIEMGKELYRSAIISFIESRPYVDFLVQLKLSKNGTEVKGEVITAGHKAILISAPWHRLSSVAPETVLCQTNQGISQMIVDINFQVE